MLKIVHLTPTAPDPVEEGARKLVEKWIRQDIKKAEKKYGVSLSQSRSKNHSK
jgi:hypothetical protein